MVESNVETDEMVTMKAMMIIIMVVRPLYLFQFNFVNCFMSLFYVAFYLQDMVLLRKASLLLMVVVLVGVVIVTAICCYYCFS